MMRSVDIPVWRTGRYADVVSLEKIDIRKGQQTGADNSESPE